LPCLICVLSVHPVLRVRVVSDWRPPAVHSHSHSAYPQHGNCTAPVAAAPPSHSIVPLVPLLLFAFVCLCRSVRTIPVRWSSVLTTRRRHSRVIFPPLLVCAQFLFVFVCDDLDSIRPHQSSSSLRRGQRRAERMSCPPAGPEGPSLLVFVCMLCSRSSPLREFLRAPAVSGVLTVFMDLSDSPTCRNQSATFGTLLGASTLSPVRAFLATNDSFVAISGCLFYTQTATL